MVPVGPGSQPGLLSNGDFSNLLLIYTRANDKLICISKGLFNIRDLSRLT